MHHGEHVERVQQLLLSLLYNNEKKTFNEIPYKVIKDLYTVNYMINSLKSDPQALSVAMIYMKRLQELDSKNAITEANLLGRFAACLCVADKLLTEHLRVTSLTYGIVAGLATPINGQNKWDSTEINRLESNLLKSLDYRTSVNIDEFERVHELITKQQVNTIETPANRDISEGANNTSVIKSEDENIKTSAISEKREAIDRRKHRKVFRKIPSLLKKLSTKKR